jgi:F0F1-type ATP synthase delta subunit
MKYKPKTYAQALVSAILEKRVEEKKIAYNFLVLLQKNQDMKKANEILVLAEKILLQKTGNKKITFQTARKLQSKDAVKLFVKKGDMIQEKINSELIAGIKIIVNDETQLDFSLKNKLEKIFT